jgi:hypothetical protein
VEDPIYQRNLYNRAIMGELSPAVEKVLMAYAWGEPPKEIKEDNERPPLVFLTRLPVGRTDPLAHLVPIESKSKALQQADRAVTEDEENKAALEVVRSIALTTEAAEDAEARENELSADLVEITLPEEPPYL